MKTNEDNCSTSFYIYISRSNGCVGVHFHSAVRDTHRSIERIQCIHIPGVDRIESH